MTYNHVTDWIWSLPLDSISAQYTYMVYEYGRTMQREYRIKTLFFAWNYENKCTIVRNCINFKIIISLLYLCKKENLTTMHELQ